MSTPENDYTGLLAPEYRYPPRIGDEITVEGVVRTVETLFPPGHYRITLDVLLPSAQVRRVVDGHTDPCPTPGYGLHIAVGAGAQYSPYLCRGCSTWFTLSNDT